MVTMRIAIIDDDMDDLLVLNEVFREKGFEKVHYFSSVDDFLRWLESVTVEQLPQLIISDLNMPKLTGIELLRKLRAADRYKHIPFMICSTSTLPKDYQDALKEGVHSFFPKPLLLDGYSKLVETISSSFEKCLYF